MHDGIVKLRHALIAGIVLTLGLGVGGCSSAASPASPQASTVPTTSVPTSAPGASGTKGDFCSQAIASIAASKEATSATDKLNSEMVDPSNLTSGDMTSIHALSQKVLDSAKVASSFYASGAASADDPDAKAAFEGLSQFISQYSVPLAKAGLDATSMSDYITSVTAMGADPALTPLLKNVPNWAVVVSNYTQKKCDLAAEGVN